MKLDLANDKINKIFYTLFASALGSTIISTIYATVDLICIGHYSGPAATAAISFVNPLWGLMIGPGLLAGVGGSVMMSNRKASGNVEAANAYYTISLVLSLIFSAIIFVAYNFFPYQLLSFFGAEGITLEYGVTYMRPVAVIAPTFTMSACLSSFMRNDGEAVTPTVATAIGGVVNMFLDVFLVFGLDLGLLGAGLATAIGQTVAFLILASYFLRKKCTIKLVKPKRVMEKTSRIVTLGASAFILELAFAATITVFNKQINDRFGEAELAVFSTASTVVIMFICLFNAIGTALQPIASTAYGGGRRDRVDKSLSISLKLALLLGIVFFALAELFPGAILKIYMDVSDEVMAVGPRIFRIYSLGIIFAGISTVSTYYFQSVLKRDFSMYVSLSRGLVLPIALAILLPVLFGSEAIWWATVAAELITFLLTVFFILREKKRINAPVDN